MERETPIARMVREAIETVATPEVRVQILHRALHMSREHEIPPAGPRLLQFVDKHLRNAMVFYVGNEATDAVMQNLEPMVSLADKVSSKPPNEEPDHDVTQDLSRHRLHSGVNRKDPSIPVPVDTSKYPTVAPLGSAVPMVFVATRNRERCDEIKKHVKGVAAVQQIEDVVSFLDNVKATASLSPLLVIDCMEASVQPSTIATLAHELPPTSAVLIWGASEEHTELLKLAEGRDDGWLRCGTEAKPSDVASLIQMFLG